jgi:hypothetical protein
MAFTVPETFHFACRCGGTFELAARQLSGRDSVYCPLCGVKLGWLDALEPRQRREIIDCAREDVEGLLDYLQKNGPPGDSQLTPEIMQLILKEVIRSRRTG